MTERKLKIKCPKCGRERLMILRKGKITDKYRKCFHCNHTFKVHTHIDKLSRIVKVIK